jgi:alanyl-tRNA synthetase
VNGKDLAGLIDAHKDRMGSGAVLLIADTGGKAAVAAGVTDGSDRQGFGGRSGPRGGCGTWRQGRRRTSRFRARRRQGRANAPRAIAAAEAILKGD